MYLWTLMGTPTENHSQERRFDGVWGCHAARPGYHRLVQSQPPIPIPEKRCQEVKGLGMQAMFQMIGQSHSTKRPHRTPLQVAARTAQAFNPSCKITPIHGNIKEERFDVAWFQSFDIVLNALDNLGERTLWFFNPFQVSPRTALQTLAAM